MAVCVCVFSRRVVLRSDRSFLPKSPEGQTDGGVLEGAGGVGGGKFGWSAVGMRGGRAGVCFLSVCLALSVSYGMFTGGSRSDCTARITVRA